ncbi:MAG: M23 family metallopeptidase [Lachnospiraceae bacterium]|nr:M23 family metallopeptidase [Lachnospiraceae bacterium]
MNNNDTTFLQKIKDNAFYIALGVGILAIIAVIAVYTMGRDGGAYEENELDLNQSADYSSINTDNRNNGYTSSRSAADTSEEMRKQSNKAAVESIPDSKASSEMEKRNVQVSERSMTSDNTNAGTDNTADQTGAADTAENNAAAVNPGNAAEDGEQLPVSADVGELNFTSDKTLTWPVSGEVILPYSMDTTVYYKTLDQYRTNAGMLIAAGSGSTVKNAYLGKVVKVTSNNTYGNMVTIYIGNDYSLVYGQLDTVYVKEGDFIKAGESVGTIGQPTDSFEDEGSHLFFQILKGDTPVDPMDFME